MREMKMLLSSGSGRFFGSYRLSILFLPLLFVLHGVILSQYGAGTGVYAARIHVREITELQRSLARYRQLLQEDNSSQDLEEPQESVISFERDPETTDAVTEGIAVENLKSEDVTEDIAVENPKEGDDVVQAVQEVDEVELNNFEQLDAETTSAVTEDIAVENPKEDEDVVQAVEEVEVELRKDEMAEVNEPENDINIQDVTESSTGDQAAKIEDSTKGKDAKKRAKNGAKKGKKGKGKSKKQSGKQEAKAETQDKDEVSESEPAEEEKPEEEEPFVFPEPYLLGPPIKDWDEQRASWLDANPDMKTMPDGKPRVLIVTGSQPDPCHSPGGDRFNLEAFKLKMDYARIHNYEIYYNFPFLDPLFNTYWVKLPILRSLMLTHPEIEWFFWVDSDAVFTDMLFEAPFHDYDGKNMIVWAYNHGLFEERSWVAFNVGVFMLRNCQWSLDLIDKWSPMGPEGPVRDAYGKILSNYLTMRPQNYAADDQSALAYLILTDESVREKVKTVDQREYMISGWWIEVVDNYETSMEKYHPGLGDYRWPWITHFTGCGPCNGNKLNPIYERCMINIERAFNFADNQVLAYMGFQHENLSSDSVIRTWNESDQPLEFVGVNPWQERIAQLAEASG